MSCNCLVSQFPRATEKVETYRIGSVDLLRRHKRPLLDVRHVGRTMGDNCVWNGFVRRQAEVDGAEELVACDWRSGRQAIFGIANLDGASKC